MMKKVLLSIFLLAIGLSAVAQQRIHLRSVDRAECVRSDMTSLQASFSFSTIEAEDVDTQRGQFSWLSMPNTVIGGNEGDPQIPVVNELIAVPFGATPSIRVTSYSSTDYRLEDFGIQTLVPRQPSIRKDQRPEDVPFVYNASAYQTRGLRSEPQAFVSVGGTMRGVRLGKMTIEPVSYDPVSNTLRVFNDIEVEVSFDGADAVATENMLVNTYSPYFEIVYKQLFNGRAIRSVYDQHPDLYTTPVKMLVVTTSTYANSTAFQNWLVWKKQKGIDVDVQTVANNATAATIKNLIYSRYNTNHPTFLVIVGDETVVTYYQLWDYDSSYGNAATDLEYASVDGDVYHDMFISRMSVSSTTELGNLVNKILTYEKYTMADPSYLNNTILIAGWDSYWTPKIGKPTIQYANNNYFNSAHGITPYVTITTASGQTSCYNNINNAGFINYTAHGDIQEWHDPNFTNSNVNSLTNNDKYFWAMGNCCLTANFKNAQNNLTCYGEAMIRAANKGAFGYIGSVPESYWFEDFYFGVGAFAAVQGTNNPTVSGTTTGCYDAMFDDTGFNTLNSVPYIGNLAVAYAHAANYNGSVSDEYYWRAYQCFGDGSVMPYLKVPAANNVSFASSIVAGTNSFRVNADAGSYVAITVNNEIIGVAAVPANATYVDVPFTTTPVAGQTAMIVVTRNQRQPYINNNVPVIDNNAPQYTITANANPTAGGTVEGAGTYYENTNCTLTAVANHGYAFNNWNDNNTENPRTITVTGNATYTANFRVLEEHQVSYTPSQSHGTISVSPTTAYAGDIVTLTATPDAGYMLDYWTVTTVDRENIPVENNQFVMPDSEVMVSATFKSEPINLTVYDGTATNQYIPMYGYYFDDYTKSECIIPASHLTAMNGCTVTAITFYPATVGTRSWGDSQQTVFLKEVSSTTLGGSYSGTSGAITVKVGSPLEMPTAGTAYTITFDTPYTYNGGNLLIGVYNDDGDYNKVEWYGTSNLTSGVSASGYNANSLGDVSYGAQTFLPKTTFTYMPVSADLFAITTSANPTNGGTVTGAGSFAEGQTCTLTATPATGYTFANWTKNGTVVSTNATYSFTVNEAGAYVANFTLNSYTVTASVNPANAGTITGAGTYNHGATATLTATANTGYTFTNWTKNGTQVSTNATYSFSVTEAATLVANFTPMSYVVTAAPDPIEGGTVAFGGRGNRDELVYDFEDGWQGWTTFQGNTTSPNSWMHNTAYPTSNNNFSTGYGYNSSDGFMLSESYISGSTSGGGTAVTPDNYLVSPQVRLGGSISFYAGARNTSYCAEKFSVMVSTTDNTNAASFTTVGTWTLSLSQAGYNATPYTVDLSAYSGMGYIAIRHHDCYDQWFLAVDNITIVEGEVEDGSISGTFNYGESCTLVATPNADYHFVNWTENGIVVSSEASYSFTVTGDRGLVANFSDAITTIEESFELGEGWNWWSPNMSITLQELEEALGTYGIKIAAQNGKFVSYNTNNGFWSGNLTSIELGKMYKIKTNTACSISFSGEIVDPAEYPIVLSHGNNWIGFIGTESMTLEQALSGITPTNRDVIKSSTGKATYYEGYGWQGTLHTLEPGVGYIYKSNATNAKHFTYPSDN